MGFGIAYSRTIGDARALRAGSFAQGGLFQYGEVSDEDYYTGTAWYALNLNNEFQIHKSGGLIIPNLPAHGEEDNTDAPLGSGVLLLIGFGTTYALKKRK